MPRRIRDGVVRKAGVCIGGLDLSAADCLAALVVDSAADLGARDLLGVGGSRRKKDGEGE
jgi:hypothetical protein